MKKFRIFTLLIFLFSMVATHAQTTGGTNFWLTFGQNYNFPASSVDLQIRVVCRDLPAFGVIYFTEIDDVVSFDVDPGEVYTYTLTDPQKVAVYNNSGTSTNNKSIHITSNQPITVYALNQTSASADATNILPLTALGTYYYQISYSPFSNVSDAYAIVVTENNTEISHGTTSLGTFNAGEVYYRTSNTDMTGTRITSNKPVAFFALNQSAIIPNDCDAADCLMQQLAPVHTWGKNFFVPVSQFPRDRVRIVASQNNTKLTLTGGVVVSGNPNNMQAGQFVELDVYYNNNGCYIQADKPVGVCTYLTGSMCNPPPYSSDPAQAWLPSIEQTASESIISPFIPNGSSALSKHYALVIAPTEMKDNTRVSIGMAAPVALAGVIWRDNAAAGMSFCTYEMTNPVVSYRFTNPQEILVMGYGTGASESYYYLGYSSMRDLSAAFYANAVHYQDMPHQLFCEHNINFTTEFAEIESLSSLNWVIDGMPQTHLDNLHTWSRNFSAGVYIVKMNITYEDESKRSYESILRVGGLVTASADPPEWGTVTGSGCYHAGTTAVVTATPISSDYIFINWTDETGAEVSTNNIHSFIVTNDNTLVAHFEMLTYPVVLLKNPDTGGIVDGGGPAMLPGQVITVMATPSINYVFVNWTEDTPNGAVASTDASFTFAVTGPRTLVANFTPKTFDVNVSVDFPASGTVCCNGTNIAYGTYYTVSVTPNPHFFFEYWSEGDNIPVSSSPEYTFLVERSYNLVAHFTSENYNITVRANPTNGGMVYGSDYNVPHGEERTVTAVPFANYNFVCWTNEDGQWLSTDSLYTFPVERSMILVANFTLKSLAIIATPSPPEGGTCTGGGNYIIYGTEITLTATPNEIYRFVEWREDTVPVSTNSVYKFTVTRSRDLTAIFELKTFDVYLSVNPQTGGTVEGGGNHIPFGTVITVRAKANLNYEFDRWTTESITGATVSNDAVFTFNVTSSQILFAHFKPKTYSLTVWANPPTGGTVEGNDTNIPYEETRTVSATVSDNYHFIGWTEEGIPGILSTELDYTFLVTRSRELTANFALNIFNITVEAYPSQGGSVDGGGLIVFGENASVTAIANDFFYFDRWTENGLTVSYDAVFAFPVTRSRHLVAHFLSETFNIALSANPLIGGTVSGGGNDIPYLSEITISATPDECFDFINWTEAGVEVATTPDYTFIVTLSRNFTANFMRKVHNITTSANPGTGGYTSGGGTSISCGTGTTVTAVPETGYKFVNWTKEGVTASGNPVYTFTVTESAHLVANFELETFDIYVSAEPSTGGEASGGGLNIPYGTERIVYAVANPEYEFVNWMEGSTEVSTNAEYSFIVEATRTLTAHFKIKMLDITVTALPPWGGDATGGDTDIPYGTSITVSATAAEHYHFTGWTIDGDTVSYELDYTFIVTESLELVANFAIDTYDITHEAYPENGGTITGGGLNIPYGTPVMLEANANDHFFFDHWTEDDVFVTSDPQLLLTVTHSQHFVAHFIPETFNITVTAEPSEGGTATGGGTDIPYLTEITIYATPEECYDFDGWKTEDGALVSTNPEHTFPVTQTQTLVAHFVIKKFLVTAEPNPPAGGTLSSTFEYVDCGTEFTVIATPNMIGYKFINWTHEGNVVSPDSIYTFNVTESVHLVANFLYVTYDINLSAEPGTGGMVSGGGTYPMGLEIEVTAVANPGYQFDRWTENDVMVSNVAAYTFIVNSDRTLVAHFILQTFNVTLNREPEEGGFVTGGGADIPYETEITIFASPYSCYNFLYWTTEDSEEIVTTDPSHTVTVTSDLTFIAHFEVKTYMVTASVEPPEGGYVSIVDTVSVDCGSNYTITATPYISYRFVNWTKNGVEVSTDATYTFLITEEFCHLVAHFEYVTYQITLQREPMQGGAVFNGGIYPAGLEITVKAKANPEYKFEKWTENGETVSQDTAYTFIVESNRILKAHFITNTFDIVLSPSPDGGGTVTGGGFDIPYDSVITITATPNEHYIFVSWTEEGYPTNITNPSYTFNVTRSRYLKANFVLESCNITLSQNISGAGLLAGGGTNIPFATMDTIKAFPNSNYTFEYWAKDSVDGPMASDDAIFWFTVTQSRHFVAIFKPKNYTITVEASPSVGGTAEVAGGGNNIPYEQMVTVIATPNDNYHFVKWIEDTTVSYASTYPFPVTRSRHLIAIFELNAYDITMAANPPHAGTVTGGGFNILFGTDTSVTATPFQYFYFDYWTEEGDTVSDDATFQFTVVKSRHLIANFTCETFDVTLVADPLAGGLVEGGGNDIPYLSEITIFATPDECYDFTCWTTEDGDSIYVNPYTFIVTQSQTLTAHFEVKKFIVTATPNPPEGGTVSIDTAYIDCGTELTIVAEPNIGYQFVNWTKDGVWVSDTAIYTFTVTDSCHLVANFVYVTYNIHLTADPYEGGSAVTNGTYPLGMELTVKAKAYPEYQFVRWTEFDEEVSTDTAFTFTVDRDRILVAHFVPATFNITLTPQPLNGGTVEGEATDIPYGEIITVSATPNPHFLFDKWTEEAYPLFSSPDPDYQFAVTRSRHLIANFIPETYNITLSANIPEGGTLEVVGGGYNIPFATLKTVIATPTSNYIFKYWAEDSITGPIASDDISYQFTVTRSRHLVAIFQPKNYNINLTAYPSAGGTVAGGGNNIPYETEVTALANPNPNYGFLHWTENDSVVSYSSEYTFPVTRSRDLTAVFTFEAYHIILAANPEEGGTVEGTEFYIPFGTEKTVKAFPKENYYFVSWTENGKVVSVDAEFEFPVTKSRYLVANFTNITHLVTLISIPFDGGTLLGGGNIPHGKEITIFAEPDGCYDFVNWREISDSVITDLPEYTFTVEEDCIFVAHFIQHNLNITTSAYPPEGGTVIGEFLDILCGTTITVFAFTNPEYNFVNWTVEGVEVSTDSIYIFSVRESCNLVANFVANNYNITLFADPPDMGTVSGSGTFSYGTTTTASALPYYGYSFTHWTEDSVIVSTDAHYTFVVERSRILVAHFERTMYNVIAAVNDSIYGYATGSGKYFLNDLVQVKAFVKEGFQFANWTIDSVAISNSTIYEFVVTSDITLIANFYELEFDEYAVTLWDNTFMLNLKKLAEEGYEVTGCKWFKNGKEERETNTIDEYSYSAGPRKTDLLELAPTFYMYQLSTRNGTLLNSTKKMLTERKFSKTPPQSKLVVYPNPVLSGNSFIIEGVTKDTAIEVFNQTGICVNRSMAHEEKATMVLHLPAGVYIIRNHGKEAKVTIVR